MNAPLALTAPDFLIASALLALGATAILVFLISLQIREFIRQHVGVMLLNYQPARVRRTQKLADLAALERSARSLEGQLFCFDRTCQTGRTRGNLS